MLFSSPFYSIVNRNIFSVPLSQIALYSSYTINFEIECKQREDNCVSLHLAIMSIDEGCVV